MVYQNPYIGMSPCMHQHPFMQTQAMMPELALMAQNAPQRLSQDIYSYPYNFQSALELIRNAVAGEAEDRLFYEFLIRSTSDNEAKEIIASIRDDEIKHFGLFRQIYFELTGRMLQTNPDVSFDEPESFCEGIKRALAGEQAAASRYSRILFAMQDRRHINMLTEIIIDELRHGTLYNYLYSKSKCSG